MVMDWAVNSSSKYRVSISDVTWGLKGGMSWRERACLVHTRVGSYCNSPTPPPHPGEHQGEKGSGSSSTAPTFF